MRHRIYLFDGRELSLLDERGWPHDRNYIWGLVFQMNRIRPEETAEFDRVWEVL